METKVYIIENLGCANCAAKMEARIRALPEVTDASITFATKQLRLTAADPDALLEPVQRIIGSIEPDAHVTRRLDPGQHGREAHCGCGHDHGYAGEHGEGHEAHGGTGLRPILAGAGLFALGLILEGAALSPVAKGAFLAAYLLLGFPVLRAAGTNLLRGQIFDENFLMSIATLGAFCIDEFAEAVGVMLFYRVGEYFEHRAVERSRKQIMAAVDLRPEVVNLVTDGGVQVIPAGHAKVGDVLLVRPGDRIPLDAVVLSGESRLDTSPITGEPVPVAVAPGDSVTSGCVNGSGQLTVRVERALSQSMVTRILEFVEEASASKPRLDRFITRFARIYTPVVVALAAATAVIPSLVTGNWSYWVYTALSFLVMSCPCALVLSVPLAFFSGIGVGSRRGILFKGGSVIEVMAGIRAVVMDKTGTVTRGDFSVQQISGGDEVLRLCAGCEQRSTHPIAESIVACARARGLALPEPESLEELPGHGIRGVLTGRQILCGNEKLMALHGVSLADCPRSSGGTQVIVAVDGKYAGCLTVADTLKEGAAAAVERLHRSGIRTAMLTGDREETARSVAEAVGIPTVYARLLPQEKLERLRQLRQQWGKVLFVGDGINDAPVLSGADVGAAMGSGADAAIEAADVVFLTGDVSAVPEALEIAAKTKAIAVQNVIFALTVKALVMVLGLFGMASMWAAVFADSGVAMLCVLNAVRMLYRK